MPRRKKKRRKQVYDELWDTDAQELARMLNIGGVGLIAQNFDCSPTTIWRATKAKGLKPQDGKYVYQPPDRDKPDEIDAWVKMVDAMPRRGPSTVIIGNGQEIFGGRRTGRALSFYCDHEWETLVYESPIPSLSTTVVRCKWCLGIRPS